MMPGRLLLLVLLAVSPLASSGMITYRPGQEYRSINAASYELIIQKSGHVDIRMISGSPVFTQAFPMVWLDNDTEPKPLPVDGRMSIRQTVNDTLGERQGMVLRKKSCTWSLRTYPIEPYFAVQVAYTNTTKKPVKIRALYPWCIGAPLKGGVYLGETPQQTRILGENEEGEWGTITEPIKQSSALCLLEPNTNQVIIAGFLNGNRTNTCLQIKRPPKKTKANQAFSLFRAACFYEPPIELAPGEQVLSEVLYLSVAEQSPVEGLTRLHHVREKATRPK